MAGQRGKESCGYSYMTFVVVVFLSHHKDVWQPAEKNVSESNVRGELRSGKTRERIITRGFARIEWRKG